MALGPLKDLIVVNKPRVFARVVVRSGVQLGYNFKLSCDSLGLNFCGPLRSDPNRVTIVNQFIYYFGTSDLF